MGLLLDGCSSCLNVGHVAMIFCLVRIICAVVLIVRLTTRRDLSRTPWVEHDEVRNLKKELQDYPAGYGDQCGYIEPGTFVISEVEP